MPRPDTGNFNRFLTSMGLVLLVAALVVPYFYFQSTDTLRIPARELGAMTATGRDVLVGRQGAIASLEPWVLVFSGLLAALGVGFLFTGGRRLRHALESEEEEGELRKSRARAEIRRLSPEQREDRRDEQARAAVEGPAAVQPKPVAAAARPAPRPSGSARAGTVNLADRRYQERREAIARVEDNLLKTLSAHEFQSHEFLGNVMVSSTESKRRIEVDGLFEARSESAHGDVLLEVRLWNESIANLARAFGESLLATTGLYRAVAKRPALGWLLVVIPSGESTERDIARVESRLSEWIAPLGVATVVREGELDQVPAMFDRRLVPLAAESV